MNLAEGIARLVGAVGPEIGKEIAKEVIGAALEQGVDVDELRDYLTQAAVARALAAKAAADLAKFGGGG